MQLPLLLRQETEKLFEKNSLASIRKAREALTQDYQERRVSAFSDESKRLAYLGSRMPATYAAAYQVLQNAFLQGSLLDLGAGLAGASWAALELFPDLKQITLVEKNPDAIALGKTLSENHPILKKAHWIQQDLNQTLPEAETAILCYVLGELDSPETVILSAWKTVNQLVIIEPGTPKGFELVLKAREILIRLGGFIVAPCPHALACPMQKNDWCHFSVRLERTKIHRLLKAGSLGYEDEKFCYLIASKTAQKSFGSRILKRPIKGAHSIRLALCTNEGRLEEKTIFQKEKNLYRKVKKFKWGDLFG